MNRINLSRFFVVIATSLIILQPLVATAALPSAESLPAMDDSLDKGKAAPSEDAYGPYFGQVMKDVRKHWYLVKHNWKPTTSMPEKLAVGLAFKVHRDGSISDIRVRQASKDATFDAFVIKSLQETAPVSPIPPTITQDAIDCFYTAHYDTP